MICIEVQCETGRMNLVEFTLHDQFKYMTQDNSRWKTKSQNETSFGDRVIGNSCSEYDDYGMSELPRISCPKQLLAATGPDSCCAVCSGINGYGSFGFGGIVREPHRMRS